MRVSGGLDPPECASWTGAAPSLWPFPVSGGMNTLLPSAPFTESKVVRENVLTPALRFVRALAFVTVELIGYAKFAVAGVTEIDVAPMNAYVFPGSALLCIALAVFLTMLGLIAEEALQKVRAEERLDRFAARAVRR